MASWNVVACVAVGVTGIGAAGAAGTCVAFTMIGGSERVWWSARIACNRSTPIERKISASFGSNCVPALRRISSSAVYSGSALRYVRLDVIASKQSARQMMRPMSGIDSPASFAG